MSQTRTHFAWCTHLRIYAHCEYGEKKYKSSLEDQAVQKIEGVLHYYEELELIENPVGGGEIMYVKCSEH